jgi:hypothetical protein
MSRQASIGLFGRDDPLRRILAIALRQAGFEVIPIDPASDPLPVAAPSAVLYQHVNTDAGAVRQWRRQFPRASMIEMSFYSEGDTEGEADAVIEAPCRLDVLMRTIDRAIGRGAAVA